MNILFLTQARDADAAAFVDARVHFPPPEGAPAATACAWSPARPEVVAASYARAADRGFSDAGDAYDGAVALWSLATPRTPEAVFSCQSQVLCCAFDASQPAVVVGGVRDTSLQCHCNVTLYESTRANFVSRSRELVQR